MVTGIMEETDSNQIVTHVINYKVISAVKKY